MHILNYMGDNNKLPLFYICVEKTKDFDAGLKIFYFLRSLGIENVLHPAFKTSSCLRGNKETMELLNKEYRVILVCISRDLFILPEHTNPGEPRKARFLLARELPLYYRLRKKLFPGCFGLAGINIGRNHICLSMDIIEKCKVDPLIVFLHELLHLKRSSDCSVEGCIGRCYNEFFYLCDDCLKLLKDIAKGDF